MSTVNKVCVLLALLAVIASVNCQAQCPAGQMDADVLILGAGMAGLGAAETFSENGIDNFLIIDQRDKIGGRVQTAEFGGGIVELGPQWLAFADEDPTDIRHPFYEYVNRCNITLHENFFGGGGMINYNRTGHNIGEELAPEFERYNRARSLEVIAQVLSGLPEDEDISVAQGLRIGGWDPRTQLQEHVEQLAFDQPFSFPTSRASYRDYLTPELFMPRFFSFANTPRSRTVVNYPEGYSAIPRCLAEEFLVENDPRLILDTAIVEIEWGDDCICAISRAGEKYCAPYAILTFSLGELQKGFVKFTPPLPMIKNITLNQLENGHFLKIYIAFNETFWDDDVDSISYFNELRGRDYYPFFVTWGTLFPQRSHVLEAIVVGLDESKRIAYQDPEITRQEIYEVMRDIYGDKASEPVDILLNDFIANPYFYGNIFEPAVGVGPRQYDEMNAPCGNLYFSGDGMDIIHHSTAHAALFHGRKTAARIVDILQGPLDGKLHC